MLLDDPKRSTDGLSLVVRRVYRTGQCGFRLALDRQGGLLIHFQYFDGVISNNILFSISSRSWWMERRIDLKRVDGVFGASPSLEFSTSLLRVSPRVE